MWRRSYAPRNTQRSLEGVSPSLEAHSSFKLELRRQYNVMVLGTFMANFENSVSVVGPLLSVLELAQDSVMSVDTASGMHLASTGGSISTATEEVELDALLRKRSWILSTQLAASPLMSRQIRLGVQRTPYGEGTIVARKSMCHN